MNRRFFSALALTAMMASSALAWDSDRYKEDFRFSYKLAPNGRISMEGFNGSIDITGWDRDEVEVTGTKFASTEEILKSIRVNIANTADSVTIKTERPSGDRGWWSNGGGGVKFFLRVPRKVQLERIASSNGSVRVEALEGNMRLTTSNGTIRVAAVKGSLDLNTSNGGIELNDVNGGMILRTSNGTIRADNVKGAFEASTSNGAIRARLEAVPPSAPIRATSSNGSVELTLPNFKDNDVRVTTSNSAITLRLPPAANAQVKASTSNSSITTEFEVSVRGAISKNRLEGKIGNGGALLDLSSSNGAIRVVKM